MLKVWFMFDNHTFARIEPLDRESLVKQATELFAEDRYGMLAVRDRDAPLGSLYLHGNGKPADPTELGKWADAVVREIEFARLMVA